MMSVLRGGPSPGVFRRGLAVLGAAVLGGTMLAAAPAAAEVTTTLEVCLTSSTGQSLALGETQARYKLGQYTYWAKGEDGDEGCRTVDVAGGSQVTVDVQYNGTWSGKKTLTVPADQTTRVDFYTTNVTVQYPGSVAYGGSLGNSTWFKQIPANSSKELLSDGVTPTVFRLSTGGGAARTPITWPEATATGKSATFSLFAFKALNNAGEPLPGVTARYWAGYGYHVPGSTNDEGLLAWSHKGLRTGPHQVEAKYNGTISVQSWDPSTTPLGTFQTTNVTLHRDPALGARLFYTNTYAQHWGNLLPAGAAKELFPGTYALQLSAPNTTKNPGNPAGGWIQTSLDVPAPGAGPVVKTAAVVRFQDSTGKGLVGTVNYYQGGRWHNNVATTSHSVPDRIPTGHNVKTQPQHPGGAALLFDGKPTTTTFQINHNGATQQLPRQNVQTNGRAYFHTVPATVKLVDSSGNPLADGLVTYSPSSLWLTAGTTDADGQVSAEVLPVRHTFQMNVKGAYQKKLTTDFSSPVVFQTGRLTAGPGLITSYYASSNGDGGWHAFPTDGVELIPHSTGITVKGKTEQCKVTITAGQVLNFQGCQ